MTNRICKTTLQVRKLSHVEADIWLHVEVELVTPTTELRGKLLGPRCPGVTTVEIAYPLLPLLGNDDALLVRALIDEPNLWTEKTPFTYEGVLELWQDGLCCDRAPVSVGLKMA